DRNGSVLAASIDCQSIYVRPKELDPAQGSLRLLGTALDVEPRILKTKMASREEFVWIERKVNPLQAGLIAQKKMKGVGMIPEQKRYDSNGSLASHLVGAVGLDNSGLTSIE